MVAAPAAAQPLGSPQQISFTAPLQDDDADSTESAIAYGAGRSLIVWQQHELFPDRGGRRTVIMGRFVDGTANPLGSAFKISDSDRVDVDDTLPDVTYDSQRDQFFVVWESNDLGDDVRGGSSNIIRGATVTPEGAASPSVVLTPDGENFHDPTTAYAANSDEYLVAYHDGNGHVHIRKVGAGTLAVGDPQNITEPKDFKPCDEPLPDTAFDATVGRWIVVFQSCRTGVFRGEIDSSLEIYGRTFDAALNGSDAVKISHDNEDDFDQAREPAVSPDTNGGGFMVVYSGWRRVEFNFQIPSPERQSRQGKFFAVDEIFSRRVTGNGALDGDAHQVSDTEEEEEINEPIASRRPDVWHDPNADQFLVTWAELIGGNLARVDPFLEYEVFGSKIDNAGISLEADTQISNHRPDLEDMRFDGDLPAVTYDRSKCDYVVSWTGEEFDDPEDKEDDEKEEIWDRAYDAPPCPVATTLAASQRPAVRCVSVRNFPIHLVTRRGRDYEFVLVKVNGQPVQVKYGERVQAQVNLIGLPLGRFSVEIEARLADNRTLKGVRRYFTCTKKLPPSNGLERDDAL